MRKGQGLPHAGRWVADGAWRVDSWTGTLRPQLLVATCWSRSACGCGPGAAAFRNLAGRAPLPPACTPPCGPSLQRLPCPLGWAPPGRTHSPVLSALSMEGQSVCRENLGPSTGPVQHPPEGPLPRSGVWAVRPGLGRRPRGPGAGGAPAKGSMWATCIPSALPCPPAGRSQPPGRGPAWACRPGWLALGVCCGASSPGRRLLGRLVRVAVGRGEVPVPPALGVGSGGTLRGQGGC